MAALPGWDHHLLHGFRNGGLQRLIGVRRMTPQLAIPPTCPGAKMELARSCDPELCQEREAFGAPTRRHLGIAVVHDMDEALRATLRSGLPDQRQGAIFVVEMGEDVDDAHTPATHHDCKPAPSGALLRFSSMAKPPTKSSACATINGGFRRADDRVQVADQSARGFSG